MFRYHNFRLFPYELYNVKINGYRGKWHSIATLYYGTHCLYLMEHDTYGDMTESLIIDENLRLIVPDVWNGFDDFYDVLDFIAPLSCDEEDLELNELAKLARE